MVIHESVLVTSVQSGGPHRCYLAHGQIA